MRFKTARPLRSNGERWPPGGPPSSCGVLRGRPATSSGGVVPRVISPLVHVPLVPLVGVDPDLGGVVRPNRPALELLEEVLRRRLGVLLSGRHLREYGQPLLRRSLQERLPVQLLRQGVDRREPGVPLRLLVGIEGLGETKV